MKLIKEKVNQSATKWQEGERKAEDGEKHENTKTRKHDSNRES